MINPDKVTPGYWYILRLSDFYDSDQRLYEIVDVKEDNMLEHCGTDRHLSCDKYHPNVVFLAPVPDPIGRPEETIKQLKIDLGLPPSASTAEVFRKSLAVAKEAIRLNREEQSDGRDN